MMVGSGWSSWLWYSCACIRSFLCGFFLSPKVLAVAEEGEMRKNAVLAWLGWLKERKRFSNFSLKDRWQICELVKVPSFVYASAFIYLVYYITYYYYEYCFYLRLCLYSLRWLCLLVATQQRKNTVYLFRVGRYSYFPWNTQLLQTGKRKSLCLASYIYIFFLLTNFTFFQLFYYYYKTFELL